MNELADGPARRTSITQLLNPVAASSAQVSAAYGPSQPLTALQDPMHLGHPQKMHPGAVYQQISSTPGGFSLRAASWTAAPVAAGVPGDEMHGRPNNTASSPSQGAYPSPTLSPGGQYGDQNAISPVRARMYDSPQAGMSGGGWSPPDPATGAYGPPVISAGYSDERTVIAGDYGSDRPSQSSQHGQQRSQSRQSPQQQQTPQFSPSPTSHYSPQHQGPQYAPHLQQRQSPHLQQSTHEAQAPQAQHPQHEGQAVHPQHSPHPQQYHSPMYQSIPMQAGPMGWQVVDRAPTRGSSRDGIPMQQLPPGAMQPHPYAVQLYPLSGGYALFSPHTMPPHLHQHMQQQQQQAHQAQQQQPSPVSTKRSMEETDGEYEGPPTKAKRVRAKKPEGSNGPPSKRGYTAKKREAAQLAAENARLMPNVAYLPNEKGDGRDTSGDGQDSTAVRTDQQGPLHPELQFARCMSNRYKSENFPRCVSCTRRWAGDTCRFQGIRFFLKDDSRNIVGISFVESHKEDSPSMSFPGGWNVPLEKAHTRRIKRTVAEALLPTLRLEAEHLNEPEVIRRPRESDVRATCDTCMTSIFSSSWMCRLCGREACAECYGQVKDLTNDRPGASTTDIATLQARREKHAHSNPFFLSCTRRNEHRAMDFSPISRFAKTELMNVIKEMEELVAEEEVDTPGANADVAAGGPDPDASAPPPMAPSSSSLAAAIVPPDQLPVAALTPLSPTESLPSHPTKWYADSALTEDVFRRVWARGEPLVVHDVLSKFRLAWTPEFLTEKYGTQPCLVVECETDANKRVTVGDFFGWFEQYEGRKECWKLKDWPSSADFKSTFPELYEDFIAAVPVPSYVRRDGALNIASHFPSNAVAPDLGPKMYNAMASDERPGSHGSTRLHMDMADAVNIMTYSAKCPDGSEGRAAWDIFRAEDADKIRRFLRDKFAVPPTHDPIHSQQYYLDAALRRQLYEKYDVKSHRIYQKPGAAVFIPAGCAHQVCNLADCVKVAVDFVSPENVARCERLTREFREQNQSMVWKEDVLQLRTMMWFAWLSCCRQERLL